MMLKQHVKERIELLLAGLCITFILIIWLLPQILFNVANAQDQLEFDYENCHVYYLNKDVFIPYQILLFFPDADKGGFHFDASKDDASYWIEKPEDHAREEGTFLGIGSNSTKRWEWQFDLSYNQTIPIGREFQVEVISKGDTLVRNIFVDTKNFVCVLFNFNAEVKPKELTNDDILEIAGGIAEDQIASVKAEVRRNTQESVQSNNLNITSTVIMAFFVIVIWVSKFSDNRKITIKEKNLEIMTTKLKQEREASQRREEYYSLRLNDVNYEIKTKMKSIENVMASFTRAEKILNNIQYIYDFIEKNIGSIAKVEKNLQDVDIPPPPDVVPEDTEESRLDKITSKLGLAKKEKTTAYLEYKEKMKKMSDHEKHEFIHKQWNEWYPKSDEEDSEGRKRIEALLKIDKELK